MKTTFLAMLSAIAMLAAPCAAWSDEAGRGYIGASLSPIDAKTSCDSSIESRCTVQEGVLLELIAGYEFNRHLALEGNLFTEGTSAVLGLSALASLPLDSPISIYGRLGVWGSDKYADLTYGVGVRFALSENWAVRLEWQHFGGGSGGGGADIAALGVLYRF